MLVLFDNGTPRSLAKYLVGHTVIEARACGWDSMTNGELLNAAEAAGFDVLVTTDRNIRYQQNLTARRISLVVLGQGRWALILQHASAVAAAVDKSTPGSFAGIDIPLV
jgi:hypothetical protein